MSFHCRRSSILASLLCLGAVISATACTKPSAQRGDGRVKPVYDPKSGRLMQLEYDSDGDRKTDVRVFMDGNRPLRAEADPNEDGRVDRWEYYGKGGQIEKIGSSSANNGKEDTWTYVDSQGQAIRIERSDGQTPLIRRREFLVAGVLDRVEEDTNGDGLVDRWETYTDGKVTVLALDTTHARGKPDRRLIYQPGGQLERIEADPDGDGVFAFTAPVRQATNR